MILLLALACDPDPADKPAPEAEETALVELDAPRLLRRLSLDLRGVLPSVAELDAVEADPGALVRYRDAWLDDPRLEARVADMLAEQWHTRVDEYLVKYEEYRALENDPSNEYPFERAVADEPLRLMAHVVVNDRPWSEVVTADYTMANALLASVWTLEREDGEGWTVARYTDGRPAAGVLATNGLWWRYYSTVSNVNRGRVAAIARLLTCTDYLSRPISLAEAPALGDAEGIEEALRSNPYCQGCHSSLDPAASALFGFWVANEYNIDEIDSYHPERERMGELMMGSEPAWFGTPVSGLGEMGQAIAADPRFDRCAVQNFAQALWHREVELSDFDRVESLRQGFVDQGLLVRPLLAAITDTPQYRVGGLNSSADAATADRENLWRMVTPEQWATLIADLTGFVWESNGFEQLLNDTYGFRVLAGGVDGNFVTRPQRTPSLTWALTIQRLAEAASYHAVQQELVNGGERRLFLYVELDTPSGDAAFTQEIEDLGWRLYAVRLDAARVQSLTALWEAVAAEGDPGAAWQALVTAMLRDPEMGGF